MKTKEEILQYINTTNEFDDIVDKIIRECFTIFKTHYNSPSVYIDKIDTIFSSDESINVQCSGAYNSEWSMEIPIWVLWEPNYMDMYLKYLINLDIEKEENKRLKDIENAKLTSDFLQFNLLANKEEKLKYYKELKAEFENE